ncbi:hypothetical protein LZ554_007227 [Drepanopeziza brunnea f. sp. 'monogermtubi']|nr:hypothetical protein LZ554_007227 [Drepanopeziza brunnea f. sp. 'monogermtubi']
MSTPSEPPPPYTANAAPPQSASTNTNTLRVPNTRNGIPPLSRRSMEDEARALPPGWSRQYDAETHHQFFVDTRASPPRSIWHHPYDDETYLSSLPAEERTRIHSLHRVPTDADLEAESSGEDDDDHHGTAGTGRAELPPWGNGTGSHEDEPTGVHKLTRKMKDKLTSSTHQEREAQRQQRARDEATAYERHQHIRRQMSKAMETGQPQLLGRDREGKEVYIEPPQMPTGFGYGSRGYGVNPYSSGLYGYPGMGMGMGGVGVGMGGGYGQQRYARPAYPYSRPYGGGYGGGFGTPLLGGLAGGALLGGLLF